MFKNRSFLIFPGLMIAFSISTPQATTYYVSVNGNDNWPGTSPDSAWRHINHACSLVTAGDTVLVLEGMYEERVVLQNSGTPGNMIVFKSEPRRTATTWGFDTNSPDKGSYVRIEGFNIAWDTTLTGWRDFGIFINSNNVEIVDNYISYWRKTGIVGYWGGEPRNIYIADNKIFHSQSGIWVNGKNWLIENNEIERLYDYGNGDCDYTRFFGDSITFYGNYFHGTDPDSIGSAHVDCFQTFDNNGEHAAYVVIEANRGFDFHQGFMGEAHYYHNSHDIVFKNNIFARGWSWGLCVQDISDVRVLNNTFADIQWHGVGFQGQYAQGGVVINNIFYNTNTSYWWSDSAQATGDYNLIFGASPPTQTGPHDILNQDPQFVDPGNYDYRLQPASPAIDSGDSLLEVPYDIVGIPRPQGMRWDIGAYEYVSPGIKESHKKVVKPSGKFKLGINPFINSARIKGIKNKKIIIYDLSGRKIKTCKSNFIGKGLKSGIYFIKVENAGFFEIIKIE